MSTYWDGTGKYQEQMEELTSKLMPAAGKCDTVAGELLRAANRLYYESYNNGWGNNVTGASNYLKMVLLPYTNYERKLKLVLNELHEYAGCGECRDNPESVDKGLDYVVDRVMEVINEQPALLTKENDIDMLDLYDEEDRYNWRREHEYED